ncbi:hypothetical protein ACWEGE_02485 [Amycolatopsis sp. NPDC004747]
MENLMVAANKATARQHAEIATKAAHTRALEHIKQGRPEEAEATLHRNAKTVLKWLTGTHEKYGEAMPEGL